MSKNRHLATLKTVPVSLRAVVQRIKRKLAKEGKRLEVDRSRCGMYYVCLDTLGVTDHNTVHVIARHLGVIKPWESIA